MALITLQFQSTSLCRPTRVQVLLPNDIPEEMARENEHYKRPAKTLVLLHGYTGSCDDWLTGSRVQENCHAKRGEQLLSGSEGNRKSVWDSCGKGINRISA